jgi:AraC family transcriptional regulator of adaptative response/methylated-DNA-[protein]-cysteine methyltransferase
VNLQQRETGLVIPPLAASREKQAVIANLNHSSCWRAVIRKDKRQDGRFLFGVITTGIYCRPSCPSRRPNRKNVRFYLTPNDAERAGLRPCRRCKPGSPSPADPDLARIRAVCEIIRCNFASGEPLTLRELSRQAGVSSFHLQRRFKAITGVTPRQFAEACRVDTLKRGLRNQMPVTDAIFQAGFGSSSRVYGRVDALLGMTPAEYRTGGKGLCIQYISLKTPAGLMMIGATDRGVCSVQFGGSQGEILSAMGREYPAASLRPMRRPGPPRFRLWVHSLGRHLRGPRPRLELPAELRAAAFLLGARAPWKPAARLPESVRKVRSPEAKIRTSGAGRTECSAALLRPAPDRRFPRPA